MGQLQKVSNECKSLRTGKNQIIKAFESKKIRDASDDEIKNELKYIFVLVGIRQYPDELNKRILLDFIRSNYSYYSLSELKIAFEMAIKREFECETNHYEIFSCNYFGQVFDAYLKYRERIAKEYLANKNREMDKQKEKSQEEILTLKREFFNEVLLPLFSNYKENNTLDLGFTPVRVVYESLKNDHKVIDLSEQEMNDIKQQVKEDFKDVNDKLNKFMGETKSKKQMYFDGCKQKAIELSFDKIDKLNSGL